MILVLNVLTIVRKFQTYLYLANFKSTTNITSAICSLYISFDSIDLEIFVVLLFRPSRVTYIIQICPSIFYYISMLFNSL